MKKIRPFTIAILGIAALAACSRVNVDPTSTPDRISIQASIGEMTKVTTTGNTAAFDTGDKIALYAWTGEATAVAAEKVVNGTRNTLGSDGTWTPDTPMLWADMTTAHYFLGIYPARDVTDFTADPFTLSSDYQASDLLIATNTTGLKAENNPVGLTFNHAMARLDVNLTFRNQWDGAPTVSSVEIKAKKTATVNYLAANPMTATGSQSAVALTKKSNAAWSGLQIPQTGANTITIKIDGKSYNFTHTSDIPLAKGQYTTVNLIVGRNTIDLGSISISPWTAGTTIDNGEAQTTE